MGFLPSNFNTKLFKSTTLTVAEDITSSETAVGIHKIIIKNNDTADRYLCFFNVAASSVSIGTTAVLDWFPVPASGYTVIDMDWNHRHANPLSVALCTLPIATGAAAATNAGYVKIYYIDGV